MRFLLYNIRYGTGPGRLPWSGYLRDTTAHTEAIARFLRSVGPDVAAFVEVDGGSFRQRGRDQAQALAAALEGHTAWFESKYGATLQRAPVLGRQGNALLTSRPVVARRTHRLRRGVKRVVMELELDDLVVFLAHLPLGHGARREQLLQLAALVRQARKPVLVAGDLNTLRGDRELAPLLDAGLRPADVDGRPTFPSWAPSRRLDYVLHSPELVPERCWVPRETLSDHLPLVVDLAGTSAS